MTPSCASADVPIKAARLEALALPTLVSRLVIALFRFVHRMCVKECQIGDVKFTPGMIVHVPVREIHQQEDLWADPKEFLPERFLHGKSTKSPDWLAFGIGPRYCIGKRFAEMEIKMTLARLLSYYTIERGIDFEDPIILAENTRFLQPKNGVYVRLVKRQ